MNRSQLNNQKISAAALAAAATFLLSSPAAHAQQQNRRASQNNITGTATSFSVTPASVPGAVEPIMNRAATLLRIAEARQNSAPNGAKQSYRASAQALRQLLASAHFSPGMGSGTGMMSAPSMSSTQVGDDIRTLRASAKSSRGGQMAMFNKAASLYATGTKEFFTAQLREALFDANVTSSPVVIRGSRSNATTAASGRQASGSARRRGNGSTQQGGIIGNAPVGNGDLPNPVPTTLGTTASDNGVPLNPGVTVDPVGVGTVGSPGVIVPGTVPVVGPVVSPVVAPGSPAPAAPAQPANPAPAQPPVTPTNP